MLCGDVGLAEGTDQQTFEYDALDISRQQLRLLHVGSDRNRNQPPSYELHTFDSEDAPSYKALSYAWGEPVPLHTFRIGKMRLQIRQNLHDFLDNYRISGYIWIDQICINQQNPLERNHQVGMMARIYSRCQQLIIWLGGDSLEFKQAVDHYESLPEYAYEGLKILLKDVYFTRLWIAQEVLLAKRIEVLCRSTTDAVYIPWSEFHVIAERCRGVSEVKQRLQPLRTHAERTLVQCLDKFSTFECLEPRDRIYALLGLVPEDHGISVDYTKPMHEVFLDAVKSLHKQHIILRDNQVEPYPRILLKLARDMGRDIKGKGASCFWDFLSKLFERSAIAVQDIGVDVTVSEPSGSETVNTWWYETVAGKVVYTYRGQSSEDASMA